MNFDTFFSQIENSALIINVDNTSISSSFFLDNEALFQLPLICMIVLLMAKDKRKPIVSQIGQMVGESLEAAIPGFKGSAQHVGWSANLRVRTVRAMTFLEQIKLIEINNRKSKLQITDLGKRVINRALEGDDSLSYNLSKIARSYRNICVSRQLDMEL